MNNNTTTAPTIGVDDGENILIRQSWLNQYVLIGVTLLLEFAIIYLNMVLAESGRFALSVGSLSVSTTVLPVIPLVVLARAAFNVYNERLVITPNYLNLLQIKK